MDLPEKEKRQTVMFSATFPRSIMRLVEDFMRPSYRLTVGQQGGAAKNIKQVVGLGVAFVFLRFILFYVPSFLFLLFFPLF